MVRFIKLSSLLFLTVIGLLGSLLSCSQYSTKPVSKGYHNLTAHYNAYVIARDEVEQAELTLFKTRQENYSQVLPILLPVDSTKSQAVKQLLDDAIKKASLIPERHQNSKWLDNAYILIGRARLLKQDLPNAIEVFKYVNTKGTSDDDKHMALVGLMRAYIEANDYTNAQNVGEYLRAQPLSKANTRDYYLVNAYLNERQGKYAVAAAILEATFPVLPKNEVTARLHLIAGQLYDVSGQPAKAVAQYKQVAKSRPSYDQLFYANLYAIQSKGLSSDIREAAMSERTFETMLADRKNAELKDKIYATMAVLEVRKGNVDKGIDYYRQSIQASPSSGQVPYTYQEIGRLFDQKKGDYAQAKAYYDSALAQLPRQSADYTALLTRRNTLDEFVQYKTTIYTEDSLLQLAKLSPTDLNKVIDDAIKRRDDADKAQVALAQQIADRAAGGVNNIPGATNSELAPDQRWVLYNPVALSQGRQEFSTRWGNRPLEDDWRRSTKQASEAIAGAGSPLNGQTSANSINPNAPLAPQDAINGTPVIGGPVSANQAQRDAMRARIPFTADGQLQANQRVETALYKLGKLYKFQFNQPADAISTFEQLLNRYPNTIQKPEVYYLLYLSNEQLGKASPWKDRLQTEFPNTSYARLTGKTATQSSDSEALALAVYTQIYDLYKENNLTEALARADKALGDYAGTKINDKLALLRVLLVGKLQTLDAYRQALNEFVRDFPASPLLFRAREMLAAASQKK
jgi:tetratricopeptide (TPR) repeat protein